MSIHNVTNVTDVYKRYNNVGLDHISLCDVIQWYKRKPTSIYKPKSNMQYWHDFNKEIRTTDYGNSGISDMNAMFLTIASWAICYNLT